jgi:hypothetical protein
MTSEPLKATDAIATYRYLRIGMIGAVVLLASSIALERSKVHCWQTSISAYYYTPVRAIFVGAMMVVGFSLIVIKGRSVAENLCLNMAGMLAPVVAVVPTSDVGTCWSIQPNPLPIVHKMLAPWVTDNIHNNIYALLIAGAIGLGVAVILARVVDQSIRGTIEKVGAGTLLAVIGTGLMLLVAWALITWWRQFGIRAHTDVAVLMFVFLIGAAASKAFDHHRKGASRYVAIYSVVAVVMAAGGVAIFVLQIAGDYTVLVVEAFEIVLFAVFWIVQTVDNWNEDVFPRNGA